MLMSFVGIGLILTSSLSSSLLSSLMATWTFDPSKKHGAGGDNGQIASRGEHERALRRGCGPSNSMFAKPEPLGVRVEGRDFSHAMRTLRLLGTELLRTELISNRRPKIRWEGYGSGSKTWSQAMSLF